MKYIFAIISFCLSLTVLGQTGKEHVRKGNELYKQGSFDSAMVYYQNAIDTAPDMMEAYFNYGDALFQQGNYEQATKVFQITF